MKKFVFELTILEEDVEGDEFWEEALEKDGTGISMLQEAIAQAIEDSNLVIGSDPSKMLKLKYYSEDD